jgi:NAD(P)-dependent dehydrogenase (short-subunit alcohol dehydrogenase family)
MAYFVTGGTGFIGRHLIAGIAVHGEPIYVLVRPASRARLERLVEDNAARGKLIIAVEGDLGDEALGVPPAMRERLHGTIRHFIHLGALYDLAAEAAPLERANVAGTCNALKLAHDLNAGCFHLVSSIAVAGRYAGVFDEQMFDQAQDLDQPYFRTKHESEALVRSGCRIPWRIYRPGMVVGHSVSGAMDKIDGPYYLFKLIQKLRDAVPSWLPLVGFEGGHINLVPVDFVASALAHLIHAPGQDGKCFHLTDPEDRRIGDVLNLFAKAAHAPTMNLRLESSLLKVLAAASGATGELLRPLRRLLHRLLRELRIPASVVSLLNYPTSFGSSQAQALLSAAGIKVPALEDYAYRLWDYWERQMDSELLTAENLHAALRGKTVLITGGSSGIGRATAIKLADAGAHVLIVGRDIEKLKCVRVEIERRGGRVGDYACDITDAKATEGLLAALLAEHGHIDILVNNAGRSIRRAIDNTYDRFHDYERLMKINYFAAVRMTLGLLPAMVKHGSGHVVCISSIGAITNAARFAAYNASKAALESFTRCAAAEYSDRNVYFTVVNMPLVRTPMIAPTKLYDRFHVLQPEQAADQVCAAIVHRPARLATALGTLAQVVEAFAPRINTAVMSESFKMFPESEAAGGSRGTGMKEAASAVAFASLMSGIHW